MTTAAEYRAKKVFLLQLFDGLNRPLSEQTADIYAMAVDTVSLAAVEVTVGEYLRGEVEIAYGRACPTSAEFSKRARLIDDYLTMKAARAGQPVLPPPGKALPVTPEMRKKVSKLLLGLASNMQAKLDEETKVHNARVFKADAETTRDPRPLAERLGLA